MSFPHLCACSMGTTTSTDPRHRLRTDSLQVIRRRTVALTLALASLAFAGCERRRPTRAARSTVAADTETVAESASTPSVERWNASTLGPALFIPGDSAGRVVVILPDTMSSVDDLSDTTTVRLLGRGGAVQVARVARGTALDSTECPPWRIASPQGMAPWSVGFAAADVMPLPLDSIGRLPRRDSTRLAAAVTRLASTIHDDPQGRFVGLPFSVRSAWEFTLADGHQIVVATLQRQINQEATPLEEHTLVIAERDARPGADDDSWTTAYSERSRGDEETVETRELLAAIRLGTNAGPMLVLSRDFGDRVEYGLLDRDAGGHWRVRWTGTGLTC
jgi:hypothetical protein